jgi:RNA 3'-phosphate cyclase
MAGFIEMDGSFLEGGGQVARTSVGLSCVTGKPVRISRIRENRPQPGLKAQHMKGIEAAARLCGGKVRGLSIGSKSVEFSPGKIKGGSLSVNVGTAGSVGLVLQTLMIPAIHAGKGVEIHVTGGTDVSWSPTIGFIQNVKIPVLEKMGCSVRVELRKRGYFPKGGGEVSVFVKPSELKPLDLIEKTNPVRACGVSHASGSLEKPKVSERQLKSARDILYNTFGVSPDIRKEYCDTLSVGSGIDLWIETGNSVLGSNSLGKIGKRAEAVGKEAADFLVKQLGSGACLDEHMGDQVIPFLGLAGKGRVTVPEINSHMKTNIWVTERFLPVLFKTNKSGDCFQVKCESV